MAAHCGRDRREARRRLLASVDVDRLHRRDRPARGAALRDRLGAHGEEHWRAQHVACTDGRKGARLGSMPGCESLGGSRAALAWPGATGLAKSRGTEARPPWRSPCHRLGLLAALVVASCQLCERPSTGTVVERGALTVRRGLDERVSGRALLALAREHDAHAGQHVVAALLHRQKRLQRARLQTNDQKVGGDALHLILQVGVEGAARPGAFHSPVWRVVHARSWHSTTWHRRCVPHTHISSTT